MSLSVTDLGAIITIIGIGITATALGVAVKAGAVETKDAGKETTKSGPLAAVFGILVIVLGLTILTGVVPVHSSATPSPGSTEPTGGASSGSQVGSRNLTDPTSQAKTPSRAGTLGRQPYPVTLPLNYYLNFDQVTAMVQRQFNGGGVAVCNQDFTFATDCMGIGVGPGNYIVSGDSASFVLQGALSYDACSSQNQVDSGGGQLGPPSPSQGESFCILTSGGIWVGLTVTHTGTSASGTPYIDLRIYQWYSN